MKKLLPFILIFITTATYCQNLIENGGFESGVQSWKNLSSETSNAVFSLDTDTPMEGRNSLKIEINQLGANPWDVQTIQGFPSKQQKKYTLRLQAKAKTAGSKFRVQVQNKTYTSIDFEATTEWKEYTWNFEAKEDDLELALHFFEKNTFFIDHITLSQESNKNKSSATTNMIPNGDLENGDEGWINIIDNGAKAIYSINEDSPYAGKKSLRVLVLSLGANTWDIQSINNFASAKGQKYRLTFMAKASKPSKKIKAQIQHNDKKIYIPKDYILTTEWKKYEWVFSAQANDMEIAFQYLSTGLYEIDSLSITPVTKKKKKKKKKK